MGQLTLNCLILGIVRRCRLTGEEYVIQPDTA